MPYSPGFHVKKYCVTDNLIRLTVFHCELTPTQNIIFTVFLQNHRTGCWQFFTKQLFLHVSIFTQLSVVIYVPDCDIHHAVLGKTTMFTVSAAVRFRVWAPFLGNNILIENSNNFFFPHCVLKASACKITSWQNKKDGPVGTYPTQRPFEGILRNSHWQQYLNPTQYTFTSDTLM